MNGANAAQEPRGPTINDRFWDNVKSLNDFASQMENVLNRVVPRPPVPATPGSPAPIGRDKVAEGTPPMMHVATEMEAVVQRIRNIALELPKIA